MRLKKASVKPSASQKIRAWSPIYLGRIHDIREERDDALVEYKTALTVRDGQPDTKAAAEKGIKQPFEPPKSAHPDEQSDDDSSSSTKPEPPPTATSPHP